MKKLLFFTSCDEAYFHFATLYPLFALSNTSDAIVEIGVTNLKTFQKIYKEVIDFYQYTFPDLVTYVEHKPVVGHHPGTLRFLYQPKSKAEYIYW